MARGKRWTKVNNIYSSPNLSIQAWLTTVPSLRVVVGGSVVVVCLSFFLPFLSVLGFLVALGCFGSLFFFLSFFFFLSSSGALLTLPKNPGETIRRFREVLPILVNFWSTHIQALIFSFFYNLFSRFLHLIT